MSLTAEDKAWITAQFHQVDKRLDDIGKRFESVDKRLDDINKRFESIDKRFEAFDARLDHVEAKIERVETSLLTEFHKWASPLEMRVHSHSATLRALDLELEAVSDRVKKLERPSA
jgi:chromosome segregation ATPase